MRMIIVAVPGAGKSSTIELVRKEIPDVKKIIYGDFMFEIAQKRYKIKDRDKIRKKLSIQQQTELQEKSAEEIAKIPGNVIVDTHASIKTPSGYWPGLPVNVIKKLKPDVIILPEFRPEDILKRRQKDMNLKKPEVTSAGTVREPRPVRDMESPEDIELQQQINRGFALAAATEVGCPVKIINLRFPEKSEFDHAATAAKDIVSMIKGK